MTNLTQSDVQPYFDRYQSQYGDSAIAFFTVDDIEALLADADDDDAVIAAMRRHITEGGGITVNPPTESEPITPTVAAVAVVDDTVGSPYSYAVKFDAAFEHDLETLYQAALENKRGAAVIMNDLFRMFGEDTVTEVWPKPNTWKAGHGPKELQVSDNEPYDKRNTIVRKPDGTTSEGTWSFYSDLVSMSARGTAILAQIERAKESTTVIDKVTDVSKLQTKLSNFKGAIVRAVELAKRMDFCNKHTKMAVEIITEVVDGKKVPKHTPKLIYVRDTNDRTKFNILTIGQFLSKPVKIDATYADIMGKRQRETDKTGPEVQNVHIRNLNEFDDVINTTASFFTQLTTDTKAMNTLLTHLNSAGSDEHLTALNTIMVSIDAILSKPAYAKRLSDILTGQPSEKRQAVIDLALKHQQAV